MHFSSLFGRIEPLGYLPRMYHHNKPHIDFVELNRRHTHHEAPGFSVNWIINCNDAVEKVESKTGKVMNNKNKSATVSRVSKKVLFSKFLNIKHEFVPMESSTKKPLYEDEKLSAKDFQVSKQ